MRFIVLTALLIGVISLIGVGLTDSFSGISFGSSCEWADVDINGQSFDSKEELREVFESSGTDFDKISEETEFRVEDGTLVYRAESGCGMQSQEVRQ